MPRSRRVDVCRDLDGVPCVVVCSYTPGTPDRGPDFGCAGGYPGDPPEVEIVEVREDAPGGALRPDLLEAAEKDFAAIGDRAAQEAAEDDRDYDGDDADDRRPARWES